MSILNIKPKSECSYDLVSLGEIMLRLDPGEGRVRTARVFNVWEGGGEYNVARGLKKCFGMDTAVVTSFADNDVGRLLEDLVMQGGVDTRFIRWTPYDGAGRSVRNGLNFTERGFGLRGALGVSDRANSAASQLKEGDVDWEKIFGGFGARWFHTGGIFAALSETTPGVVIEAVKAAKKHGVIVSYDLNYRPSLWKGIGGTDKAREVNTELVRYVDVLFGNEEDFSACLGRVVEGSDESLGELNTDGYIRMIEGLAGSYPNLKVVANTLRTVKTAAVNDWSAICWADGKLYKSKEYKDLDIYDRVGGGDSFASGLIYGLMTTNDPERAVDYGAAHGALVMTTPGDTSMASVSEVEGLMKGMGARIKR